jgi:hypothetical protein
MAFNPFVVYSRCGGWGFCLTFGTNLVMSNLIDNPTIQMKEFPKIFTSCLLFKSLTHGILWPTIPFQAYRHPESYLIVGRGIEKSLTIIEGKGLKGMKESFVVFKNELKTITKWKN